jgi:hypothetical protein
MQKGTKASNGSEQILFVLLGFVVWGCTACRAELRLEPAGREFALRFALKWKMSRVASRAELTARERRSRGG